jgi:hypothetical protein
MKQVGALLVVFVILFHSYHQAFAAFGLGDVVFD